jgi:uncharacterized protein YutE (UPF0331/DUF86 family)
MVDAERLLTLFGRVTSRLAVLERYAADPGSALLSDEIRLGHLKYTFQTAIEACIDAAQHVVADHGLGTPASNADAFRLLAGAGVLDDAVASSMAGAVGFRNVLVHGYADVDDRLVVANLSRLSELRAYVTAPGGTDVTPTSHRWHGAVTDRSTGRWTSRTSAIRGTPA